MVPQDLRRGTVTPSLPTCLSLQQEVVKQAYRGCQAGTNGVTVRGFKPVCFIAKISGIYQQSACCNAIRTSSASSTSMLELLYCHTICTGLAFSMCMLEAPYCHAICTGSASSMCWLEGPYFHAIRTGSASSMCCLMVSLCFHRAHFINPLSDGSFALFTTWKRQLKEKHLK
jgi:hypothetical protein